MNDLEKTLNLEGKYFLFCVEDTLGEKMKGKGEGFELYQLVKGKMKPLLIVNDEGARTGEEIVKFLEENTVSEVYNPLPEIVGEFKRFESYDELGEDGDFIHRWPYTLRKGLFPYQVKEAGIRLIGFD
jgi:hypothetical protein